MGFTNPEWLFPVLIILHNAEEALWPPAWAPRTGFWRNAVSPGAFGFAAAVLTVLGLTVTWMSARSGSQTLWMYLTLGYMAAMLSNAVYPHLAISIATRSYMPGAATAIALNPPVLSLLLASALVEGHVSGWRPVAYVVGVSGLLADSIQVLFKLGRVLNL